MGALDKDYAYKASLTSASSRGYSERLAAGWTLSPASATRSTYRKSCDRGFGDTFKILRGTNSNPRCSNRLAAWMRLAARLPKRLAL